MNLNEEHELPPLSASATIHGGLRGAVKAEVTLGPVPPPPPYERARLWMMRLRWFIEPLVTGISDAFKIRRPENPPPSSL